MLSAHGFTTMPTALRRAHEMELDIRLAARVCSNLVTLRFRVAEIAELALGPVWSRNAT